MRLGGRRGHDWLTRNMGQGCTGASGFAGCASDVASCHAAVGSRGCVGGLPQVRSFVDGAYKRTVALVERHRDLIEAMTQALLRKEVGWGAGVGGRDGEGAGEGATAADGREGDVRGGEHRKRGAVS
jgi:hypothetical protein